jgi:hypothetical protein
MYNTFARQHETKKAEWQLTAQQFQSEIDALKTKIESLTNELASVSANALLQTNVERLQHELLTLALQVTACKLT